MTKLEQLTKSTKKMAMLTCYDATFAKLCEAAGVDILLVGDSLGMVIQGATDTLSVTMHDMVYHTQCVAKGASDSWIIADMPVASYEQDENLAYANALRLIDAGAHMVKLEGGGVMVKTVRYLVEHGIAVCAHLGFTPQSVQQLGGYKIQGKTEDSAQQIMQDAIAMSAAGAGLLVLEMIPAMLAQKITASIATPTIGIGAGPDCSGQVLVLQDLLGIYTGPASKNPQDFKRPRFVRNFLQDNTSVQAAIAAYVTAVKNQSYPAAEHCY
jgi:3-methyl-2-oxobutanoate hydroxymethyltransferase